MEQFELVSLEGSESSDASTRLKTAGEDRGKCVEKRSINSGVTEGNEIKAA